MFRGWGREDTEQFSSPKWHSVRGRCTGGRRTDISRINRKLAENPCPVPCNPFRRSSAQPTKTSAAYVFENARHCNNRSSYGIYTHKQAIVVFIDNSKCLVVVGKLLKRSLVKIKKSSSRHTQNALSSSFSENHPCQARFSAIFSADSAEN